MRYGDMAYMVYDRIVENVSNVLELSQKIQKLKFISGENFPNKIETFLGFNNILGYNKFWDTHFWLGKENLGQQFRGSQFFVGENLFIN